MSDFQAVDILLVEDNSKDAELTMRALRKRNLANQIVWVEDGTAALDFIFCRAEYSDRKKEQKPKVVLLDLKLPKIDGLEVLKAIKADPESRQLPVVILTSSREDPDIKSAYELGANSYVVKPVNFDSFIEAVANLGMYWLLVNQTPM